MEHDAACEMAEVRRVLERNMKFSAREKKVLFEEGVGGIACCCYERQAGWGLSQMPKWADILDRTVEFVMLMRAQKNRSSVWNRHLRMPQVGDRFTLKDGKLRPVEGKVILVDFRNRRRVD